MSVLDLWDLRGHLVLEDYMAVGYDKILLGLDDSMDLGNHKYLVEDHKDLCNQDRDLDEYGENDGKYKDLGNQMSLESQY